MISKRHARVKALLTDFQAEQNTVQKERRKERKAGGERERKRYSLPPVKICLQALRLQQCCQKTPGRNEIHVDFTEKAVTHISLLIYCVLTSSLWYTLKRCGGKKRQLALHKEYC